MRSNFLTNDGLQNIKKHKYKAGVISPLDQIISNKVDELIEYVPKTIAPNLITLIGFTIQLSSTAIFLLNDSSLDGTKPSWTYLYAAIALFLY